MQVLNPIKKDILLAGNYLFFSILILIILPIFMSNSGSAPLSSSYILLMSVSFSSYFFFNNIFLVEDKYKGNLYLLAVFLFALAVACYFFLSTISISGMHLVKAPLTFPAVSVVFLAVSLVFSIFFPLYFRYSYTKIKIALMVIMIILPTWGFVALASLFGKKFVMEAPTLRAGSSVILLLFGFLVMALSARFSTRFLENSDV